MENKVKAFIKNNNLIEPNSTVVIALSGGVDSMVLFDVIKKLNYNIVIAHVNHKVRLESEIEEEYIRKLCQSLNIPFEILYLEKINNNFEATAHHKRYEFFINVCKKYNSKYLLTAHHADDNLETIFLNLISGSNLYGYGGISKALNIDGVNVVRPLLLESKDEIKAYALKNNIKYFEDYTNSLDEYTRNRIRHHIVPRFKEECPNILERSNAYSNQIHEAFSYIRGMSIEFLKDDTIDVLKFNKLHSFQRKDVICLLLEKYNIERNENLINDLVDLLLSEKPQSDYSLKNGYTFKRRYDTALITKDSTQIVLNNQINGINESFENDRYRIYLSKEKPLNAFYLKLCYNDIVFPLTIRNRINGDEIEVSKGHKKLKDIFIDKKIPMEVRDTAPVIAMGNGEILWVFDIIKSNIIAKYKDNYDVYLIVEVK